MSMQHRSTPNHEVAKRAQSADQVKPNAREGGHSVIEQIERSESLPAIVSATEAFESVMGALIQRLPAEAAAEFVERRLPVELGRLLQRDADEALEDGTQADLAEYLDEVSGQLEVTQAQAREITDVVIGSLRLLMSAEEVDAIAAELSPELASMWKKASNVAGASGHSGSP
jgi:uncharacterized protein (DUF2267 family)